MKKHTSNTKERSMALLCKLLGHKDKKFVVSSHVSFWQTLGMIRVRICERCSRWELLDSHILSENNLERSKNA